MNAAIGSGADTATVLDPVQSIQMAPRKLEQLRHLAGSSGEVFHAAVSTVHELCILLNDADADALAFAREGLERARPLARVECVEGNVLRGVRSFEKRGPFDLVMAGGLFDYLSDRQMAFVVSQALRRLLKPGGTLFFTNIATGNPYRVWIEYCADWRLIERSEAEIRSLVAGCFDQALDIEIARDATGLTHLVRVRLAG